MKNLAKPNLSCVERGWRLFKLLLRDSRAFLGIVHGLWWTVLFGRILGCAGAECRHGCARLRQKITVFDKRDLVFRRARASLHDGEGRIYIDYVMADDVMPIEDYVRPCERDITWCYGWRGKDADAFKATVTMQ